MSNQLKVLQFICPTGFYGAERWVLALARNINPSEVRCDLAVTKESETQDLSLADYYPANENKVFKVPMKGRFDFSVVDKLVDIIKERDIDIIHTHGYKSDIIGLFAARRAGIKSMATPHGFGEVNDWKLKVYIKLGCLSFRYFDSVVPLSKQLMSDLARMGVQQNKLSYIANGVDLTEVDAIRETKTAKKPSDRVKKIGFIGAIRQGKNVGQMIDVFDLVWQQDKNVELVLVGDGVEREEVEAKARALECGKAIKFLGFRNDRLKILRDLDVFTLTSLSEGIPRCLMESLGMGTPIAAFDIPGVDQLVENDVTGLLAPVGSTESLAKCWLKILHDDVYAAQLSENGLKFVNDNFSGARMAKEYTELFNKLVKTKH